MIIYELKNEIGALTNKAYNSHVYRSTLILSVKGEKAEYSVKTFPDD